MRVLVSGGGTAGHISPTLATLDALKSLDSEAEILYVGGKGGMESKIVRSAGLTYEEISAGKFRRYANRRFDQNLFDFRSFFLNLGDVTKVVRGIFQSFSIIRRFQPQVIFIKGGYVGLPIGLAAKVLRVPFVLHESDTVPGLTNRVLARWAAAIAVGFPVETYKNLPEVKLSYTGNPIRSSLTSRHRLEGITRFKLNPDLPVVLVTGGSLGSRAINNALLGALPELIRHYQILHIAGEREVERVRFMARKLKGESASRYQLFAFMQEDLGLAMAVADMVVSRAGASSIAELAALGKPSILIPNPYLSGSHQPKNAQALARQGAVRVIQEDRLSAHTLVAEIDRILNSEEEQSYLSKKIQQFANTEADKKLAKLILEVGEGKTD